MDVLEALPVGVLICENDTLLYYNPLLKSLLDIENTDDCNLLSKFHLLIPKSLKNLEQMEIKANDKYLLANIKSIGLLKYLYVVTDITSYKKLHREQVRSRVLRLFMHEFKTPLNWLNGILSSIVPTKISKPLLKMAKHATNLLNLYIDDMAFYNLRDECSNKTVEKNFNISKCVQDCIAFISSDLAINNIRCSSFIPETISDYIRGDPIRYRQILNNILCNCVKSCQLNTGEISIALSSNNFTIYTKIIDNGTPMSKGELSLLQNPFDNLDEQNNQIRFGLGLILCKDMCKRCGGDFSIINSKGLNVFTFWIPYKEPVIEKLDLRCDINKEVILETEEKKSNLLTNTSEVKDTNKKEVLVVDDTPFNNMMIKHMLQILNVNCEIATNGKDALEKFNIRFPFNYSLILMDINMPVMDGIEV
jgi:signal transduction histidine kinase